MTIPSYCGNSQKSLKGIESFKPMCKLSVFSPVELLATLWTIACQAPLSMAILQARILEWVAMPFSRESSQPRDQTHISSVSCIGRQGLYHWRHLGSPSKH